MQQNDFFKYLCNIVKVKTFEYVSTIIDNTMHESSTTQSQTTTMLCKNVHHATTPENIPIKKILKLYQKQ